MDKKYILTDEKIIYEGRTLYRIQALKDFGDVKEGDLGGFVESEDNLSHYGECWIYDNACVSDNAMVYDNACVSDNAMVYDNAWVFGNARVFGDAKVFHNTKVHGNAKIHNNAWVSDNAMVFDSAMVSDNANVFGDANVFNNAKIFGDAKVFGDAIVYGNARVSCEAKVFGKAEISGDAIVETDEDYIVFKNHWSSGRYFTWTRSNNMWRVGCFYGTGEQLVEKAYKDSELSGKMYELYVDLVKNILGEEK